MLGPMTEKGLLLECNYGQERLQYRSRRPLP